MKPKRLSTLQQGSHVRKLLVEPVEGRKHKSAIMGRFAEVVRHALHLAAIVQDGKITLHEVTELRIKIQGLSLLVPDELLLISEQNDASGGTGHMAISTSSVKIVP